MGLWTHEVGEGRGNISRRAHENEHVRDLETGVVHAAKLLDEQGGCTWCAYTFFDPDKEKSPVDDFQGKMCLDAVTCMGCIARITDEEAANKEEDAWRRSHGLVW